MGSENDRMPGDGSPKSMRKTLIWVVVIAAALVILFVGVSRAPAQEEPPRPESAEGLIGQVRETLAAYGVEAGFERLGSIETEDEKKERAEQLAASRAFVSARIAEDGEMVPASHAPEALELHVGAPEIEEGAVAQLVEEYGRRLQVGDLVYQVFFSRGSVQASTMVAVSPAGDRTVGVFLDASRVGAIAEEQPRLQKTATGLEPERTLVLTRYLWGSPAETVYGRVDATCTAVACNSCLLIEERGTAGFFGAVTTSPKAVAEGRISGNCCHGAVNYTYATGFKKIKFKGVEIEGLLGQSGQGSLALGMCG